MLIFKTKSQKLKELYKKEIGNVGTKRIKRKFLLFPRNYNDKEIRWLGFDNIVEEYVYEDERFFWKEIDFWSTSKSLNYNGLCEIIVNDSDITEINTAFSNMIEKVENNKLVILYLKYINGHDLSEFHDAMNFINNNKDRVCLKFH